MYKKLNRNKKTGYKSEKESFLCIFCGISLIFNTLCIITCYIAARQRRAAATIVNRTDLSVQRHSVPKKNVFCLLFFDSRNSRIDQSMISHCIRLFSFKGPKPKRHKQKNNLYSLHIYFFFGSDIHWVT